MTPIRTLPAFLLLFLASLLAPAAWAAITQDDLLPVDEAFVLETILNLEPKHYLNWKLVYSQWRSGQDVKKLNLLQPPDQSMVFPEWQNQIGLKPDHILFLH